MRFRGLASPEDIDVGSVFDAVKHHARWLVAVSIMFGALTFGVLSLVAPRHLSEVGGRDASIEQSLADIKSRLASNASDDAQLGTSLTSLDARVQAVAKQIASNFPEKGALSAVMMLASLMLGTASIVGITLFRKAKKSSLSEGLQPQSATSESVRSEPLLSSQPQPLSREMQGREVLALREPVSPASANTIPAGDVGALSSRLLDSRRPDSGYRTLLTAEREGIDVTEETVELVNALAQSGAQVILIDWNSAGEGIAQSIGLDTSAGLNDLFRGDVSFGEIIQRMPGSSVHAIASGKAMDPSTGNVDPDRVNLVLDALDEAYDHIVVTGRHDEARRLFEAIEGRFDTGIVVVEQSKDAQALTEPDGMFLGFEVADIDIVRFERRASTTMRVHQRIARVAQRRPLEMARRA